MRLPGVTVGCRTGKRCRPAFHRSASNRGQAGDIDNRAGVSPFLGPLPRPSGQGYARGRCGAPRLGVRSLDHLRCFLSSALLLHRFRELATRAVEDVNLGHVFEIELVYQIHCAATVRARSGRCDCRGGLHCGPPARTNRSARMGWPANKNRSPAAVSAV
jgi:hypothetical protein